MCDPCSSPCNPCDPCGTPFECSPKCYNGAQLDAIPQCAPRIPPPLPKCITVQQPPRLICKKSVVFTEKVIPEPMVVNRCRQITIPKVVDTTRVIKVPKLTWVNQMVREPRVIYYPSMVPDPYVVCYPKRICEPREVCQSILCQPKPQALDIPPPQEYCCYPTGPINYKPNAACPPFLSGPCGAGVPNCAPCGITMPSGPSVPTPYGPCRPFKSCFPGSPFEYPEYSSCAPSPWDNRCAPCGPYGPQAPCGPCEPYIGPCNPCGPSY